MNTPAGKMHNTAVPLARPPARQSTGRPHSEFDIYAIITAAIAGCTLALMMLMADRGLDFTDEGFYLHWISRPSLYEGSRTQFGFIYHPIFQVLGSDIANLRRFNIAASAGAGLLFSSLLIGRAHPWLGSHPVRCLAIASGLALAGLVQLQWRPFMPSYNWLNLLGVLSFLAGAILLKHNASRWRWWSCCLLVAVGLWLTTMAKPPTAVALGFLLLLYVLAARERRPFILISAIGALSLALIVLTAWLIEGSLQDWIRRLTLGQELGSLLNAGHTPGAILTRFDKLNMTPFEWTVFGLAFCGVALVAFLSLLTAPWIDAARWAILMAAAAATLLVLAGVPWLQPEQSLMQQIWLAAVPMGILVALLGSRRRELSNLGTSRMLGLLALLLCAPAAYALGTANNQWFQMSNLLIAVLGATAVVIGAISSGYVRERLLGTLALGSAMMTAILLSVGINNPYRSPVSLRDQTQSMEIGPGNAVLKLSQKSADYIRVMREAARREGFAAGTPVLDLTGRHPTTVYAMGGVAPGLAWLIGGFPGSVPLVRAGLRRVPCAELARAWLLVSADEPRRPEMSALMALKLGPTIPLPRDTLQPLGLEQDSYRPILEIASPIGYGQQLLLAPTDQGEARKRCETARSVGPVSDAEAAARASSHPGVQ